MKKILLSRCAFFQGQIEEPVRGLTALLMHQDMPVLVGINERGLYLIDNIQAVGFLVVIFITSSLIIIADFI